MGLKPRDIVCYNYRFAEESLRNVFLAWKICFTNMVSDRLIVVSKESKLSLSVVFLPISHAYVRKLVREV